MSELRLTAYEIGRLLRVRRTWLFIAVFVLAPILLATDWFGLGNRYFGTMSGVLMLLPAKDAALAGALAAILLTLLEMQRLARYRMSAIVETATNPLRNQLRQTAAIVVMAAASTAASLVVVLPYTMAVMGSTFKAAPYVASWVLIHFGAILFAVLLASGFFMMTRRLDISFIVVGFMIVASRFLPYDAPYLLSWVQTNVWSFSDATSSELQRDAILYCRLVWLLASAAVYLLGLASIRRYGKDLLRAFLLSIRKVALPALAAALAIGCFLAVRYEPFIDSGPILKSQSAVDPDTGIVVYKTDESSFRVDNSMNYNVDLSDAKVDMTVDTAKRTITGEATYTVRNFSDQEPDVPFSISPGLEISRVYENDKTISFKKNTLDNFMTAVYHLQLTAEQEATLKIEYAGSPRSDRMSQRRQWGISDQFVLIPYTFPIPNGGWNMRMDCTLTLPERLTPIIQETVINQIPSDKVGYKKYQYESNGHRFFIAGDYHIEKLSAGGQEISFIYLKDREQVMKRTNAAGVVADVVEFFTEKFGPLDFRGEPFVIAELDASFVTGGWALGNMSVFGEAMLAGTVYKAYPGSANMEGGAGIGVAVHEIAHQWWGWSPDSVYVRLDGRSPWSGEGLTVYSTYLYMKARYGEEYARRELSDVWAKDTRRMQNAFYLNNLQYVSRLGERDAADIYGAFEGVTHYELMPYLLLKAERLVGGEDAFVAALKDISRKYRKRELTYETFLNELGLSKEDMRLD